MRSIASFLNCRSASNVWRKWPGFKLHGAIWASRTRKRCDAPWRTSYFRSSIRSKRRSKKFSRKWTRTLKNTRDNRSNKITYLLLKKAVWIEWAGFLFSFLSFFLFFFSLFLLSSSFRRRPRSRRCSNTRKGRRMCGIVTKWRWPRLSVNCWSGSSPLAKIMIAAIRRRKRNWTSSWIGWGRKLLNQALQKVSKSSDQFWRKSKKGA